MRKTRVFFLINLIFFIIFVIFFTSCSEEGLTENGLNGDPINTETESMISNGMVIKVGTDPTYPPFGLLDQGNIIGFDIDIIDQIFLKLDKEYVIEDIDWGPDFSVLIEGDIDLLISAVPYMQEKEKTVDFSEPYYTMEFLLISLLDSEIKIKEDLLGKKIGMLDTTPDIIDEGSLAAYQPEIYTEVTDMVSDLKEKKIDGFLLSVPLATVFLQDNMSQFKILEKMKSLKDFVIVLQEGSTLKVDIDQAISELKKEQVYEDIYNKWFNSYF